MWSDSGHRMCSYSTTSFYLAISDLLARGSLGEDTGMLLLSSAFATAQMEAWLEGLMLALALAGAVDLLAI